MEAPKKPARIPKPPWLKKALPTGPGYEQVRGLLTRARLHTVCQEAKCPNLWECFSQQTSTFLIMGPRCTRSCRFCAVEHGPLGPPDPDEPARVAAAVRDLGLRYAVVTSVTRDDLPDGGASHFARTLLEIRRQTPGTRVEVLVPDFQGSLPALHTVLDARPDVLNHNIETVARLYPIVRPEADYRQSLTLLREVGRYATGIPAKSGLMLGLGESNVEIRRTLNDLHAAGCNLLTLGQYLQPSREHLPVERFVPPDEFERLREEALALGFDEVASGPFVRSSYHAQELFQGLGSTAKGCP